MSKQNKTKEKIVPHSHEWEKIADGIARSFVPNIYPCASCDYPVIEGFVCFNCGDANPSRNL